MNGLYLIVLVAAWSWGIGVLLHAWEDYREDAAEGRMTEEDAG